jgi:hypothetical protein
LINGWSLAMKIFLSGAVAASLLWLTACGGGGESGSVTPPPPPPPPAPTYTVGGTVGGLSGTLVLQNNAGNDLSVAANGMFTFSTALVGGASYSVTVKTQPAVPLQNCVVTNGSGAVSAGNVTNVSIVCTTTPPPVAGSPWEPQTALAAGPVELVGQQLTVNAAGDAVAVWVQPQPVNGRPSIWGAGFHPGSGWSVPQLLRASQGDALVPRVGIDAAGNAVVVWRDSAPTGVVGQRYAMWSARAVRAVDGAVSWSAAVKLPSNLDAQENYSLAVSPSGIAVLAWREYFPAGRDTSATVNLAVTEGDGLIWSLPAYPEFSDGTIDHPVIAFGAAGDAAMAWEQSSDSGISQVLASRRAGAGIWVLPQLLTVSGGNPAVLSYDPRVAVAGDGKALVVWQQYEGSTRQLWSSTSASGGAWVAGAALTAAGVVRRFLETALTMNAAGQAVLAWGDVSTSYQQVWTRRYSAVTGSWASNEVQISSDGLLNNSEQQVAMDSLGRATVVWRGSPANPHVFARSSDSNGSWPGMPQRIDEGPGSTSDSTYQPQLGVDGSGNLLAIWSRCLGPVCGISSSRTR